jgi:uncharacterized protein
VTEPVKDTKAMIAGMKPERQPGVWHFVSFAPGDPLAERLASIAYATMNEPEGPSLLLSEEVASQEGLRSDLPMAHILLSVHSALDGVGLTAAVAVALADHSIPCNVIAGARHDHIFVPVGDTDRAIEILKVAADNA